MLDLGADEPAALAAWKTAPIVRFTLAAMRSVVDPGVDLFAVMTVFHRDLPAILGRPDGREAFAVVMRYIVRKISGLDVAELAAHLAKLAGPEAGEVVMSTAQELIDQGVKQGLEQGEAKGVRETLTRLLVAKFGRLDAATTRRLADATLSDLARWTEQILSAKRVDDVFARAKASRRGKRPRGR